MEEEEKKGLIFVESSIRQKIHDLGAEYLAHSDASDLYYKLSELQMLRAIPELDDKPLKDYYKGNYKKLIKLFNKLGNTYLKIKIVYDSPIKDKEKMIRELFNKEFLNTSLINVHLDRAYYLLLKELDIRDRPIPNEYIVRALSKKFPQLAKTTKKIGDNIENK